MILAEITSGQRSIIMELAHAEMGRMREADMNAWLDPRYVELENLSYQLFIDCAE